MKKIFLLLFFLLLSINLFAEVKIDWDKFKEGMGREQTLSEKVEDFFNPEENVFIGIVYILLIITFCFFYPIQIGIVIIGLLFHLFKQKQTVKYLLIPYGFILILKNIYRELK